MWFPKKKNDPQGIDTTSIVASIAHFLIDDTGSDLPTPFKEKLEVKKLDYSSESLQVLDNFINSIRRGIKNLSDAEFTKLMLRTGAYCGEVIRENSKQKLIWATYDEVLKSGASPKFPKSGQTFYLLVSEDFQLIYFPMAKAVKFMKDGPADNFEGLLRLSQVSR